MTKTDLLDRRDVFTALSTGLAAGLTAPESLKTLQYSDSSGSKRALQSLISALESGKSVTDSFRRHQLGSDFDLALLKIGERSGTLAIVVRGISHRYELRLARLRKLRSAFALPVFVALLALFVLPLPQFVKGTLDPADYAMSVAMLALVAGIFWHIVRIGFSTIASTTKAYPTDVLSDLPFFGDFVLSYSRAHFLERLKLLYASGYPVIEAIEISQESLVGFMRQRRYEQIARTLRNGRGLGETFEHLNILSGEQLPIFVTAEAAGRLEDGLNRLCEYASQAIDRKIDAMVTWVPRFAYTLLAITIAARIL